MATNKQVVDLTFNEVEVLSFGDWLETIKAMLKRVEQELVNYELAEVTLTLGMPPSGAATFKKKGATKALRASTAGRRRTTNE